MERYVSMLASSSLNPNFRFVTVFVHFVISQENGMNQSKSRDMSRRHLLAIGGASIGATLFATRPMFAKESLGSFSNGDQAAPPPTKSFRSLKQIDAGVLNVGYAEEGPVDGPVVILLHGWPYDIHSYVEVAPILASAGYRVIVPHLRGYGTTQFLSAETLRNGQQASLAVDIIALMDALKIGKAILGGFDWGAR